MWVRDYIKVDVSTMRGDNTRTLVDLGYHIDGGDITEWIPVHLSVGVHSESWGRMNYEDVDTGEDFILSFYSNNIVARKSEEITEMIDEL